MRSVRSACSERSLRSERSVRFALSERSVWLLTDVEDARKRATVDSFETYMCDACTRKFELLQ